MQQVDIKDILRGQIQKTFEKEPDVMPSNTTPDNDGWIYPSVFRLYLGMALESIEALERKVEELGK